MERVREIIEILCKLYPDAGPELNFANPYETLVATILSAQSTDRQVNKVTPELFRRYPDVKSMSQADVAEVYQIVKSCGFKSKADNIVKSCRIIMERHAGEIPSAMDELTALPGVGRKTANVVLSNAFGVDAIAVDTHVFRVSNRLGLAKSNDVFTVEKQLMGAIPREKWSICHHYLIFHGRRVCHSRSPECGKCALTQYCAHYPQEKHVVQPK